MTYPDTPGAQAHSETSIEAARIAKGQAINLYHQITAFLDEMGRRGATCDAMAILHNKPNSTMGARLRELELQGRVIKSKRKRKTSSGVHAFVYLLPKHWQENDGKATVKEKPIDRVKLEIEHARMKKALDEIWKVSDSGQVLRICREGLGQCAE